MIYLPNWMYELLPYCYLFLGGMATLTIDQAWGRASGLALIALAALIIKLRTDSRREALAIRTLTPSGSRRPGPAGSWPTAG